jgi:hypothetical protein
MKLRDGVGELAVAMIVLLAASVKLADLSWWVSWHHPGAMFVAEIFALWFCLIGSFWFYARVSLGVAEEFPFRKALLAMFALAAGAVMIAVDLLATPRPR